MTITFKVHPEDYIRSELRKKHGSVLAFERIKGLSRRAVSDVLRGRPARPTAEVIAAELGHTLDTLFPGQYESAVADGSAPRRRSHRQNAGAR